MINRQPTSKNLTRDTPYTSLHKNHDEPYYLPCGDYDMSAFLATVSYLNVHEVSR
jgi:hypothetical protein